MSINIDQSQRDKARRRLTFDEGPPITEAAPTPTTGPATSPDQSDTEQPKVVDLSQRTLAEKMDQIARWNFDFENEVPLDGNWEWERVSRPRTNDHKEEVVKSLKMDAVHDRNV